MKEFVHPDDANARRRLLAMRDAEATIRDLHRHRDSRCCRGAR
jgi:hypothetical protein